MQFRHESAPTKVLGASCKNCTLYFNSCHFQKVFHHHVYLPYQNWTQLLHPANCQREEINFNRNCTFWHWVYTHPKRVICKISHPLIKNILIWTVCHMLYFSMWHICYAYKQYGSQTHKSVHVNQSIPFIILNYLTSVIVLIKFHQNNQKVIYFWRFDLYQRPSSEDAGTRSSSGSWHDKLESSQESGRTYDWVGSSLCPGSWIVDLPSGYTQSKRIMWSVGLQRL